jgi:ParB-like chromosome segregation protein Spo0J
LFPLLDDGALNDLAEDIRRNGLLVPIVRYKGLILDGRNRFRACQRAGVEPQYRELDDSNDPTTHVVSANLHRRHLSESQRAMAAAKLAKLAHGQRQTGQLAALPTQAEAAAILRVGERSVRRAAQVRDSGSTDLVSAVERGDISVSRAAKIARKPTEQKGSGAGNPPPDKPRSRRKPAQERAPELSSLSWSQATPEMRAGFVDAVGLEEFWRAAGRELQKAFIARRRSELQQSAETSAAEEQVHQGRTQRLKLSRTRRDHEYQHRSEIRNGTPIPAAKFRPDTR